MRKHLKSNISLSLVALVIAIVSAAFTGQPKKDYLTIYMANEGVLSAPIFPLNYTNVSTVVLENYSGIVSRYAAGHCTNPSLDICVVTTTDGISIIESFMGSWHS
jgi:hypothetical protein